MKTLDFRGFPVDSDIHLDSKMNIMYSSFTSARRESLINLYLLITKPLTLERFITLFKSYKRQFYLSLLKYFLLKFIIITL